MDPFEKQLVTMFAAAWNETAPGMLQQASEMALLTQREVTEENVVSALAVAATWPAAYALPCSGDLTGIVICLFKDEESTEVDTLVGGRADGKPRHGARALVKASFDLVAENLAADYGVHYEFGECVHIDLGSKDGMLAQLVGSKATIGTYSWSLNSTESQALLLYAPMGSLAQINQQQSSATAGTAGAKPESRTAMPSTAASTPQRTTGKASQRDSAAQSGVKNIERLLDVELDIVVRFGVTNIPLRDVVRLGVGSMLELNRVVDAPVEILVNGRSLAHGDVVVIDGYYGVRITSIGTPNERAASLL